MEHALFLKRLFAGDFSKRYGCKRCPILLAVAVVVLGRVPTYGQQASFQGLGDLPGGFTSNALDVSADGSVVVGRSWSTNRVLCSCRGVFGRYGSVYRFSNIFFSF